MPKPLTRYAMLPKIRVINQELDNLEMKEVLTAIGRAISNRKATSIATVNPEFMVESVRDKRFAKVLADFDLKIVDGVGITILSAIFGAKFKQRITGADLTRSIINIANNNRYKIVTIGSSDNSAFNACRKLRNDYPSLQIDCIGGGVIDPHHIKTDIIDKLRAAKPDILLVGLGAPKQEFFIENIQKIICIPVAIGVGGTIDFISGTAHRAPGWLRSIGLEWLWRLVTQPRRLGRIFTATVVFPIYYLRWKLFGSRR